jgi:acyl-coenzyme A thioesterase PaaI-like protein
MLLGMAESSESRRLRWKFNFFPAFRATGAKITYIAADFREVRLKLPLSWLSRNYVGTIYGGSMFGCLDGLLMVMLIRILGRGYVVWDKAATIRYLKPGRTTLFAKVVMEEAELEAIRRGLETEPSVTLDYVLELTDAEGVAHARVEKTLYIRRALDRAGSTTIQGPASSEGGAGVGRVAQR